VGSVRARNRYRRVARESGEFTFARKRWTRACRFLRIPAKELSLEELAKILDDLAKQQRALVEELRLTKDVETIADVEHSDGIGERLDIIENLRRPLLETVKQKPNASVPRRRAIDPTVLAKRFRHLCDVAPTRRPADVKRELAADFGIGVARINQLLRKTGN
jgi:hypothetical protein